MNISRSFALTINELLIADMNDLNGVLFLNISFSVLLFLFAKAAKRSIDPFTIIYRSL